MNGEKGVEIWNKILKASLSLPNSKINREAFLRKELSKRISSEQVELAIKTTPAKAKISKKIIDDIADSCINWQTFQVTLLSFIAGLPGGWWMAGTIPADLTQFYWHTIQLVQKLIYLYGWPELFEKVEDDIDDETLLRVTIFIGVMFGASAASKVVAELAEKLSLEVSTRLPRKALTKYGIYNLAKQISKWIGVKLTKTTFSRAISKLVPILGGFISGGISYLSMAKMGKRLQRHLRELPLANQRENGDNGDAIIYK